MPPKPEEKISRMPKFNLGLDLSKVERYPKTCITVNRKIIPFNHTTITLLKKLEDEKVSKHGKRNSNPSPNFFLNLNTVPNMKKKIVDPRMKAMINFLKKKRILSIVSVGDLKRLSKTFKLEKASKSDSELKLEKSITSNSNSKLEVPKNKIEKILGNKNFFAEFQQACKKGYCGENSKFLKGVYDYKKIKNNFKRKQSKALEIINNHIKVGSRYQVNIDKYMIDAIMIQFQKNDFEDLFKEANAHVISFIGPSILLKIKI